jgi:hypothetical protein
MQVDRFALPAGEPALPPGAGSPIVAGPPRSLLAPVDDIWFHALAVVVGLGVLIATELGIAGGLALF